MTTIALAGKGGTGKTTVAALLVRHLVRRRLGTVLAIDADPSSNLNLVLGLPLTITVGDIREEMLAGVQRGSVGTGITRHDFLKSEIRLAVEEGDRVDLLAMGRPEGQGCYCPVNHMLREIIDGLGRAYDFIVIDNEAGMEHLSRRTTRDVDCLLVVTDPTVRGVKAAEGIVKLASDLQINVGRVMLVVNRVEGELPPALRQTLDGLNTAGSLQGIELAGLIPADPRVGEFDAVGRPLVELEGTSPAAKAIEALAEKLVRLPTLAGGAR
ncbi:MAG: AAA family ATPase [Chloroflexi bacterium]|nr:AAA family ATPase [Chloroflexota bacterium]